MNPETSGTDRLVDRLARSTAFDQLADAVQPTLRKALEGTGPRAALKDILHGKQLGHSLHAAVTDVPVGAWTLAVVFDGLELVGRKESPEQRILPLASVCWAASWRSQRASPNGATRPRNRSGSEQRMQC
jgi:hypothetical protein